MKVYKNFAILAVLFAGACSAAPGAEDALRGTWTGNFRGQPASMVIGSTLNFAEDSPGQVLFEGVADGTLTTDTGKTVFVYKATGTFNSDFVGLYTEDKKLFLSASGQATRDALKGAPYADTGLVKR